MDIALRKRDLRQTMTTMLKSLSHARKYEGGRAVSAHVEAWLPGVPLSVGLFKSLADEIVTDELDIMLKRRGVERLVACADEQTELQFIRLAKDGAVTDFTALAFDRTPALELDVIFMPGLAFDHNGGRLGRGRGCFDRGLRDLASWPKRPILVGLLLDEQLVDYVPTASHDIVLDYLCTPKHGMIKVPSRDTSHA